MKNVIMNLKRTNQQLSSQNQGLNNTVDFASTKLGSTETKVYISTKQNLEAENTPCKSLAIQILERMVASNNSIVGNSTSNSSCEIDSFTITSGSFLC